MPPHLTTSVVLIVLRLIQYSKALHTDNFILGPGLGWQKFTGIPNTIEKKNLKHFELNRVQFDSNLLLDELESCPNLISIKLTNVVWDGYFSKSFDLQNVIRYSVELPLSRNCSMENISEFQSLLFFIPDATSEDDWSLDNKFELIDIVCSVTPQDVVGFMEKRPQPETLLRIISGQELVVRNINFDILQHLNYDDFIKISFTTSFVNQNLLQKSQQALLELQILHAKNIDSARKLQTVINMSEQMKYLDLKLEISNLNFSLSDIDTQSLRTFKFYNENQTLNVRANVTFLKLRHLELGSLNSPTKVNGTIIATRLKTLILQNVQVTGSINNTFTFYEGFKELETFEASEMEIDISALPTKLNRIDFKGNTHLTQSKDTYFPKIKILRLDSTVDLDESTLSSFSKTFKNIRSVIMMGTKTRMSPQFLFQVLNTSATYFLFRFNRNSINDSEDQTKAKQLLLDFGVPEDYSFNSIVLQRDSKRNPWLWSYKHKPMSMEAILYFVYPITIGIVSIFGIIGNILNAIILFRKQMQCSTSYMLLCLTLCDFVILCTSLNLILYALSNGFRYRHQLPPFVFPSDLFLKRLEVFLFYPLRKTAYTGSVYTTILITCERFIAVCFPFHAKRLISIERSIGYCVTILLGSAVLNLPRWFESYSLTEGPQAKGHMSTVTLLSSPEYRKYYHGWLWTLLIYVVPIFLIGSFNVAICFKVRLATRERMRLSSLAGRGGNQSSSVDMNLTRMLLCLVLVFVTFNLIHAGIVLYHTLFEFLIVSFYWDKEKDMSEIEVVACLPMLINSSVNFIIYCAMGRKFREEFLKLIPNWVICSKYKQTMIPTFSSTMVESVELK